MKIGKTPVIGPKIGAWVAGGSSAMVLGINMVYYTDFTNGTLCLRPEIGFGVNKVKVVYGYNIGFSKMPSYLNGNNIEFAFLIGVKKVSETKY